MRFFKKGKNDPKTSGNIANIQENVFTKSERDGQRRF